MPRAAARKTPPPANPTLGQGVVRTAKAIPIMPRMVPEPEASAAPARNLPCSGRCGHCDVHPCQLHAPI